MNWRGILCMICPLLTKLCCEKYFFVDGFRFAATYASNSYGSSQIVHPMKMVSYENVRFFSDQASTKSNIPMVKINTHQSKPSSSKSTSRNIFRHQRYALPRATPSAINSSAESTDQEENENAFVRKKKKNAIRMFFGSITGISLTALRGTLHMSTSSFISTFFAKIMSIFPLWARYFMQPFLILYYAPLLILRGLIGVSESSKAEQSPARHVLDRLDGWIETVLPPDSDDVTIAADSLNEIESIQATTSDEYSATGSLNSAMNIDDALEKNIDTESLIVTVPNIIEDTGLNDENQVETCLDTKIINSAISEKNQCIESPTLMLSEELNSSVAENYVESSAKAQQANQNITASTEEPLKELHPVMEKNDTEISTGIPKGQRWAISAPSTNLSGNWIIVVSDNFMIEYDQYLNDLGTNSLVRKVASSVVGFTREEIIQEEDGRRVTIKGKNPRGVWERSLVASGSDLENDGVFKSLSLPSVTADSEPVKADAWWENDGKIHVSWMRGGTKYGGGDFLSKRYLENETGAQDSEIYVCDSTFYRLDPKTKLAQDKPTAYLKWKFRREDITQ